MDDESKQLLSAIRDNTHTLYYYDAGEHLKNIYAQLGTLINFLWAFTAYIVLRTIRAYFANR